MVSPHLKGAIELHAARRNHSSPSRHTGSFQGIHSAVYTKQSNLLTFAFNSQKGQCRSVKRKSVKSQQRYEDDKYSKLHLMIIKGKLVVQCTLNILLQENKYLSASENFRNICE